MSGGGNMIRIEELKNELAELQALDDMEVEW